MQCPTCSGDGKTEFLLGHARKKVSLSCPTCDGTGEIAEQTPAPTLADVIALLERQAETCERIAMYLDSIVQSLNESAR